MGDRGSAQETEPLHTHIHTSMHTRMGIHSQSYRLCGVRGGGEGKRALQLHDLRHQMDKVGPGAHRCQSSLLDEQLHLLHALALQERERESSSSSSKPPSTTNQPTLSSTDQLCFPFVRTCDSWYWTMLSPGTWASIWPLCRAVPCCACPPRTPQSTHNALNTHHTLSLLIMVTWWRYP